MPAIEQSWPAGIARDHSSEKGIEPASSEEESRNAGKDSKATRNDNIAAQNVDVSRETSTSNDDKGNGRVAESTQKPDGSASLETISAENPDRGIEKSSKEEGLQPVKGAYLTSLKVDDISPNAHQPRSIFDEDELVELSHSIQEVGVLQPIVVRQRSVEEVENDRQKPYELIMGERRWRASSLANIEEIPAIVKTTPDDQMLRDALLENLHRVALNPLEEAAAYQQMIQEFGLTQEQLSQSISKSRPQIANMLRLLQLPGVVQKKVASGVISAGHARALLALSTQEEMESLANRIIAEGLSVRSTEEIVSMTIHRPETQKTARQNRSNIWTDSEVRNSLEDRFETKVSIKGSQKKGRIEIVFSSPEDMQRIVDMLLPAAQNNSDKQDGWVYSVR
ncbi:ParB/RepB/Spo0J family partition protein [Bifidobacterium fermentum]|uniref:ParB/RepB/Spo0J family partition protein n=1 Tax=Bifidobacterium TaxID=1678 RepID=UPI00385778E0